MQALYLEVLGVVVAAAGGLFGLWTQSPAQRKVAWIASSILLVGALISAALVIVKDRQGTEDSQNRQLVDWSSVELDGIRVEWVLKVPPKLSKDILDAGELIADSRVLSHDEVSRLPRGALDPATDFWRSQIQTATLLKLISARKDDLEAQFSGERLQVALKSWRGDKGAWVENIGSTLQSNAQAELLLPLTPRSSAVLSLGDPTDDVNLDAEAAKNNPLAEDFPQVFEAINHSFTNSISSDGKETKLVWAYDKKALERAAGPAGGRLTAGMPRRFALIVVEGALERNEYAEVYRTAKAELDRAQSVKQAGSHWSDSSTLRIFVNGIEKPFLSYRVKRGDHAVVARDRGAYHPPEQGPGFLWFECEFQVE